jgi:acyl-CoA thioester hydrolase
MSGITVYRMSIPADWVDAEGHVRGAYFAAIFSSASDALMDRLGMDATYRADTACTLYSLEMHMHQLGSVNAADFLEVDVHLLETDQKRLRVGFDIRPRERPDVVATGEFLYLHVRQGNTPKALPFPSHVEKAIERFKAEGGSDPWGGPGSRPISLA